jgi:enoyl-CoA hydratase/carnithine racemase
MNAYDPFGRGTLKISRRDSVLIVAINRPSVKNAMNEDVYEDLIDIFHSTAKDPSVSAIVLTGTGSYFSSGADLKGGTYEASPNGRQTLSHPGGRFMMALIAYPKILAAAVNGPTVGIAATALLHFDLVYFSSTATFWAPFTRLALVPELCSSVTLQNTMGLAKANELLLLGKKIDAETAVKWNISSRVVPCNQEGDPFHPQSLASLMADELNQRLLSLPLGERTAQYFVQLIRGSRRAHLQQVCRNELVKLDERFDTGQVAQAAKALQIGRRSKL